MALLRFLPTTFCSCGQPASVAAEKQDRPSETTVVEGTSFWLDHSLISFWLKPMTSEKTAYTGLFCPFVWTAATNGTLFSEPRPLCRLRACHQDRCHLPQRGQRASWTDSTTDKLLQNVVTFVTLTVLMFFGHSTSLRDDVVIYLMQGKARNEKFSGASAIHTASSMTSFVDGVSESSDDFTSSSAPREHFCTGPLSRRSRSFL